ncbi:MAG: hypothetical protein LBE12_07745 [Planctomycetaceae bacterium]|jgi:sporulation protein YlmC with PRC-barrel domain|nr:hypothetical protein [Planctomycetaceae bacterium]
MPFIGNLRFVEIDITADGTSSIAVTRTEIYRTSTEYDTKGRVWKSIVKVGDDIRTTVSKDHAESEVC